MAEQRFGRVIGRGSDAEIAQIRLALVEATQGLPLPRPFEECLTRDYIIEFHTPAEFKVRKFFVPGTKRAAYGYVVSANVLWVNSEEARQDPALGRHIIRHEIAHALWAAYLNFGKKVLLLPLMRFRDGTRPTKWQGVARDGHSVYENRPSEIIADKLAVAVSGKPSPWDQYRFFGLDITDLRRLIEIMFQMPEVPPVVDPHLAEIAALKLQLVQVQQGLATAVSDLATVKGERDELDIQLDSALLTISNLELKIQNAQVALA